MNILKQLNQRPIAYYPIYREITGSTTAGLYLSQLMYWFSKKDKIFKTDKEIIDETLLTEKEIRNAKIIIKKLDFITVKLEGIPAKTYYEIDWEKYETSLAKRTKQDKPKGRNCTSQKGETNKNKSLTETTTETTTENKKDKRKKPTLNELTKQKIEEANGKLNQSALAEWIEYKKYKSIASITKTINFLSKYDFQVQQQIVDTSIRNGYQGIFEPKQQQDNSTNVDFALQHNVFDIIESIPDEQNTQEVIRG